MRRKVLYRRRLAAFTVLAVMVGGLAVPAQAQTAPEAPSLVEATGFDGFVELSWRPVSGTGLTYQYQQGTTSGTYGTPQSAGTGSRFDVTGLNNGTTYYFQVRAVDGSTNGAWSAEVSAMPSGPAAPGTPTGLTATANSGFGSGAVLLSWTAPSGTVTGYQYQQRTGSTWPASWSSAGSSTSIGLSGLTVGTTYYFRVRAVNGSTTGGATGAVSYTVPSTTSPPGAPTSLRASAVAGGVQLTWTAPSGTVTGYQYQQRTGSTWPASWSSAGSGTSLTVSGLNAGTTYFFRVRAQNAGGAGPASDEVSAIPALPSPPAAPTGLTATPRNGAVTLSWTAVSGATSYDYQFGPARGDLGTWTSAGSGTSVTVSSLTNGTDYNFRVRGVNAGGVGAPSAVAGATPNASAGAPPTSPPAPTPPDTTPPATTPPADSAGPFADVPADAFYATAVRGLNALGVFARTLCAQGFCPSGVIDRKTMAVWTVRILDRDRGDPQPIAQSRFADVNASGFHARFIERLATLGISKGCGDGANFCPDRLVTRAQMAVFLTRAFNLAAGPNPGFVDVPSDAWYADEVASLAASRITLGCQTNPARFCPDSNTTRAQMATFLWRATNRT